MLASRSAWVSCAAPERALLGSFAHFYPVWFFLDTRSWSCLDLPSLSGCARLVLHVLLSLLRNAAFQSDPAVLAGSVAGWSGRLPRATETTLSGPPSRFSYAATRRWEFLMSDCAVCCRSIHGDRSPA
ncbi:hypothetical protein EXIGLDRAFT_453123 [Exidia glandulosa HHB12029]|uniref:Uncharacterized protein n=1 Tax=Exidia glandulosa HHB12029 TaxID=1314781 RepID=A0A165K7B2_EXIGL|nr:hypothetical protein EXIGLDRAFT_453123 [Exidia glandulosa HHB12029]